MARGLSPHFWQHLYTIDPHGKRLSTLIAELEASSLDPLSALLSHRALNSSDHEKLRRLDLKAFERVLASGVRVLRPHELGDPYMAAESAHPALFAWGDTSVFDAPLIGIVGTRGASAYGLAAAQKFAEELAASGAVIVSGGAIGIDTAAHKGALAAGGRTVAVLPTGVDIAYPSANRQLYAEIRQKGCLISQFPCGTGSFKSNFLTRNSTIAALSDALLVVEAPYGSGALSTAREAADLNRDVFVVPANITNPGFNGSHGLIRDGATLVTHPQHIIEAMGLEPPTKPEEDGEGAHHEILQLLSAAPLSAEKIAEHLGLLPADTLAELTLLEVEGKIMRSESGYARKP